jgi:hypothetical protein
MRMTGDDRLDVEHRNTWRKDKVRPLGLGDVLASDNRHFIQTHFDPLMNAPIQCQYSIGADASNLHLVWHLEAPYRASSCK